MHFYNYLRLAIPNKFFKFVSDYPDCHMFLCADIWLLFTLQHFYLPESKKTAHPEQAGTKEWNITRSFSLKSP